MIEVKDLTKRYGQITAVDSLNFSVKKGEVVGFLGPNGAGKSTTMNIITGYISSTEGKVTVDGYDILENPKEVKRKIGFLPEQPPVYFDMTVIDYLKFSAELKDVDKKESKAQIDDIMQLVRIADHRNRLIKNLSKGYKQRVGLAQALIGSPEVLILDEPTVGLDPKQIIEIRKLIKALGKEHTIILSSHILPEVSAVCEKVIIINEGKIAAIDTPDNLSKGLGTSSKLTVTISGPKTKIIKTVNEIYGLKYIEAGAKKAADEYTYVIESDKETDIRKPLFYALAKAGYPILEMRSLDMTLEDIFLHLTTSEKEAG
jgi:ABC-2 type transport system ATP-binding protein